jgi:hypothetical protein
VSPFTFKAILRQKKNYEIFAKKWKKLLQEWKNKLKKMKNLAMYQQP